MKLINKHLLKLLFLLLVLTNLFIRIWHIDQVPASLFGDELDVGLQAYSILTTGKDYYGNTLPVMFHSFSEYRLPLQLYMSVPFIKLFGLNEIGVRSASVMMGLISIYAIYLLMKSIFGFRVGLISAVIMAFSPWHLLYSRQANDAGFLLPFVIMGTYFMVKSDRVKDFYFSVIFFAFSIYAYAISSLFTPIYFLAGLLLKKSYLTKHKVVVAKAAILGFVIVFPYFITTLTGSTTKRFSDIGIINNNYLSEDVISDRVWSNTKFANLLYNKPTAAFYNLFDGYTKAFSFDFLFSKGDPNPRQSVSKFGLMYHFDVVLLIFGLINIAEILRNDSKKRNTLLLLIIWLLIAPVPSILTKDGGNHASRLILMLPLLVMVLSLGFEYILTRLKRNNLSKLLFIVMIIWIMFDATRFVHRYFVIWPKESWRFWQTGFKETVTYVRDHDNEYRRIIFNNTYEPMLPRFLFWYGYDMKAFQNQFTKDVHIPGIIDGLDGFKLGEKYYFGDLKKPVEPLAQTGVLIVASAEKDVTNPQIFDRSDLRLVKTVYAPVNELPIFYLFTSN